MMLPPTRNAIGASKWEPKWLVLVPLVLAANVVLATLAWFIVAWFIVS
jgi:hypothetical protein